MRLSEYLAQPGKTATAVASHCEVSVSTITRIAAGKFEPRMKLVRRIIAATEGDVTAADLAALQDQDALATVS